MGPGLCYCMYLLMLSVHSSAGFCYDVNGGQTGDSAVLLY